MTVNFKDNVLTVVTEIPESVMKSGIADLAVYDEKTSEELFSVSTGSKGSISRFGLVCNAVIDGNLAVVEVMPIGTDKETVMKKYGKALVEIKKFTKQIADNAAESEAAINEIFA